MYSKELVSAVAALGLVSGVAALGCKDDPVTITNQADADIAAACTTIPHDVFLDNQAGPNIVLNGQLREIGGSLIVRNNSVIQSLQSTSLQTIGGSFELNNVISLVSLVFGALKEVGDIKWITLDRMSEPTFGPSGITKANSVTVSDTFIENLSGINVQEVTDMFINNNRRLSAFSSSIKSLSNVMVINDNGLNLTMDLPNLQWIANMTIANVSSISVPSLRAVNGSMRFDSNLFSDFIAPNLTEIQTGDLSFVSNKNLQNISVPLLTMIGGGFTIANNTQLGKVNGFDNLETVGGAIKMRGSFDEIDLPKLHDVVGTAEFVSTEDITKSCDTLKGLSGNVIQGTVTDCTSDDANANNSTSPAGSDGGDSGSADNGNAATTLSGGSISAVVTLAALTGLIATFL